MDGPRDIARGLLGPAYQPLEDFAVGLFGVLDPREDLETFYGGGRKVMSGDPATMAAGVADQATGLLGMVGGPLMDAATTGGKLAMAGFGAFDPSSVKGLLDADDLTDPRVIKLLEDGGFRKQNWLRPDNSLSPGGKKYAPGRIESYNRDLIKKASRKHVRDAAKKLKPFLDTVHKNQKLNFKALSLSDLGQMQKTKIYKSPTYGGQQSSEYYFGFVDGKPAYIRKSNHWGDFRTNIKVGDPDAPPGVEPDWYGRVGSRPHSWNLDGGATTKSGDMARTSQVGYILLEDIPGYKEFGGD